MRTLLIALLLQTSAIAEEPELRNEDRAYFEDCEVTRRIFLAAAARDVKTQKQLITKTKAARYGASARKGKAGAYDFPTKEAKDEALDLYESTLDQMERLVEVVDKKQRLVAPKGMSQNAWPKEAQVWPVGLETGTALLTFYKDGKASIRWAVGLKLRKIPRTELDLVAGRAKRVEEKVLDAIVVNGQTYSVAEGIDPKHAMTLWRAYQAERKKAGLR